MSLHVRGNARNIGLKENQNRAKDVSQKPSTRRTALGNVTNQIRKQPQRIAKDKVNRYMTIQIIQVNN